MSLRSLRFVAVIVCLVGMTGCPPVPSGAPNIQHGIWLFYFVAAPGFSSQVLAAEILPNGAGNTSIPTPPAAHGNLGGTLTWLQNGSVFSMEQDFEGDAYNYAGNVLSSGVIEGTVLGPGNVSTHWVAFLEGV